MRDIYLGYQIGKAISGALTTNNRLSELISNQDAQQLRAQQESRLLDGLVYSKNRLNQARECLDVKPAYSYWGYLEFSHWCQTNGVSQASFSQLSNKEAFASISAQAEEVRQLASQQAQAAYINELENARKAMIVAPVLRAYHLWIEVQRRMKTAFRPFTRQVWTGTPFLVAYIGIWLFCIPFTLCLILGFIAGLIGFEFDVLQPYVPYIMGVSFMVGAIYGLKVMTKRTHLAHELNELVQSTGGSLPATAKISQVKAVVAGIAADLEQKGIPVSRLGEKELLEAYERNVGMIRRANATYGLQMDLSAYPETVGV